jgi:hypothetical protein
MLYEEVFHCDVNQGNQGNDGYYDTHAQCQVFHELVLYRLRRTECHHDAQHYLNGK